MPAGGRAPKRKSGKGSARGRGYPSASARGRGASSHGQGDSLEDTSSVGTSGGDEDEKQHEAHDEEEQEVEGRLAAPKRTQLCMWEFGQNDPKVDSGSRLTRMGLAKSLRPQAPFHGIVLSPMSNVPVSPADRELIRTAGLAGINCSWNRIEEIPWDRLRRQGQHRILPFLVAANSINYGRPHKLNTAEAMAAALLIAGFQAEADAVLGAFAWGDEFLRLNSEVFEGYRAARNASGVRTFQAEYIARCRAEAQDRRDVGMDLPPSDSGSEEEDEEKQEGATSLGGKAVTPELEAPVSEAEHVEHVAPVLSGPEGEVSKEKEEVGERPSIVDAPAGSEVEARGAVDAPAEKVAAAVPSEQSNNSADALEQSCAQNLEESSTEAPALAPAIPSDAAVPREQKATLAAIQSVAAPNFLQSTGLAGLSGNALAKLKRSEFEAIWRRFCTEEAPGLSAEQAALVLSPGTARQQKPGRAAKK